MSPAGRAPGAERFAARARRRRLRRVAVVAGGLLGLALTVAGVWAVGWSSMLSVQNVAVEGVEGGLEQDVAEAAEVPPGTPLVRVDTDEVARRVDELPAVGGVEIRRSWPQTLTIDVQPRVAVAAVPEGDTWWSIDENGVLFGRSETAPDGVGVLRAPTEDSARLARRTGAAVVTSLPASVDELVDRIEVESAAEVRLVLDGGATVLWGTDERATDKARVLLALIDEHADDPPSVYDVSAPDHPAVVP